jgi:hypothetical protein
MCLRDRFWAIYMSGLHGECTPAALQQVAGIPAAEAKGYLTRLVADGVIRPNPLLSKTVAGLFRREGDGVLEKIRERLEMKAMREECALEYGEPTNIREVAENRDELNI